MTKKEINNYVFYKIVCLDNSVDLCYVGSTANWKARNYTHKSDCYNQNKSTYNFKLYTTIRENGGWNNFKMIQIGTREQLKKREAEQIEEEYRVELKANMNGKRCFITEEQKQNYYEENKEKLTEYHQNYYKENKEKITKYHQNYYEENKDKCLEKVKCDCGCELSKINLIRHKKTPKHIKLIEI